MDLPIRVAAFFYLLVLVFLFPALTRDVVNLPVDFLRTLPPWALLTRDHHTINSEINDLVLQIVPWAHQVRESWRSLHVPLWNALSGSGYPLMANAQSSAFSLMRLIALPLPLGQSFAAEAAMKLLIAQTFTFLFCRRRGYSELASAIGAVCFGFCSFLIVWLHFPLVTVSVFVPAALYQLDLLAERVTTKRFVFTALLWAVMILSGHPETVAHIFFISLLYVIWIVAVERIPNTTRFLIAFAGALAVSALLAAPFLAPFAEAITKSKRFHELQLRPASIGYYSDWPSFIVLLQPRFFGALPADKPWGPEAAESITGFAGALGIGAWFTLLIHVIRTRRWRSRESFFVLATIIVLGIILGWPGVSELFHVVMKLAANARLRLLFCFLLAVMTAAAVDLAGRDRSAFLAGVAISAGVILYLLMSTRFANAYQHDTAVLAILPSVLVLLIATSVRGAWTTMLLAVAIIAELWTASRAWNPNVSASLMYPETPLIAALHKMQQGKEPQRIVGAGPSFFVNVPAVYGFEDIRAHDPMSNGRYLGVLRELGNYETGEYFAKWQDFDTRLLDFLNVRYVVTTPYADLRGTGRYQIVYDGKDGRIFENTTALPRVYITPVVVLEFNNDRFLERLKAHKDWGSTALLKSLPVENDRMRTDLLAPRPANAPRATLHLTRAAADDYRMHVNAPRYSMVVSSIPWWPGWKVTHNGKRLEPLHVNGSFIGFVVPPGSGEVRLWYSPVTFNAGVCVSLLTAVALVITIRRR